MNIVFALLAHGAPRLVERLVRLIVSEGHKVALHYDLKSSATEYRRLVDSFADCDAVCFAKRVPVRWAEWSMVEAALNCLDAIEAAGWRPDYVYHLSGMDYPIRPSSDLVGFLARNKGREFIESVPAGLTRWAKTGPQTERYEYRFYFNWRDQHRRCAWLLKLQKKLGLKRRFVRGLAPHIGSQWWVLTWDTLCRVRELAREPDILRFFRTTLVPDEIFFQTMVRHLVPESRIVSRTLTLYQFSDYGFPVVYYTDHLPYLLRQPFFMARKLSPRHPALRDALDACWHGETRAQPYEDAEIGIVDGEYESRRETYRHGVPGRPVAGRAPRPRYGDLERLTAPFFAVIGASTAELRLAHSALKRHPALLCHGQLLHPRVIEFADRRGAFAGYRGADTRLRGASVPNFFADVVRAERERISGLLLRWGQGGKIAEVLMERPNARILLLRGDPLVAFSEEILGFDPLLDDAYDAAALYAAAPHVLADRFRSYAEDFRNYRDWLSARAAQLAAVPGRALAEIEFPADGSRPAVWLGQLEDCLEIILPEAVVEGLAGDIAQIERQRRLTFERLMAGDPEALQPAAAPSRAPEARPALPPAGTGWSGPRPAWAVAALPLNPRLVPEHPEP